MPQLVPTRLNLTRPTTPMGLGTTSITTWIKPMTLATPTTGVTLYTVFRNALKYFQTSKAVKQTRVFTLSCSFTSLGIYTSRFMLAGKKTRVETAFRSVGFLEIPICIGCGIPI